MNLDAEYGEYREYIEEFAKTIDPHDQLPLRVSGYCLRDYELHGEIIEWLLIYLGKSCPTTLRIYLIQTALKKILEKVHDSPEDCGYDKNRDIYQPLKLVRVVVAVVNSLIFYLQDNSKLYEVPLPPTSPNATELTKLKQPPKVSVDAIKNSRRTMEDRHVIIDDFNGFFNTQDTEPTFYYGIFDGHSGSDAATYANSHLNYNISVHPSYPSDIKKAMTAAFLVTDIEFLKKASAENLQSGTTALCAIYRKTQKKLYIGWCGDSEALIARLGNVHQIVRKHSPEDEQERKRIEDLGGVVLYWSNTYRVNGSLAVSRAIGDAMHKPFVSAEPEISVLDLDGEEDFFVMGCDGLWDSLSEDDIALTVYKRLKENPNNYRTIASELCSLAKSQGSRDNISVIVVYLKEPELIATQSWPSEITQTKELMEDIYKQDVCPTTQPQIVTMDQLGNQDIMNNPFGDFLGKSTEITDLVMNQQIGSELTDRLTNNALLNNINNNIVNNGSHDADEIDNEPQQHYQPQQEQSIFLVNDDNNNSNDNFNNRDMGPETDVDAIDDNEVIQSTGGEAAGGEKERSQMEDKETADLVDRVERFEDIMTFDNQLVGNSYEDEITQKDQQEFVSDESEDQIQNQTDDNVPPTQETELETEDNKPIDNEHIARQVEEAQGDVAKGFLYDTNNLDEDELKISANDMNEEVAIQEEEQPQITDLEVIGSAQGIEESDGSDDEWNYIKVEDKKEIDTIPTVQEHAEYSHQEELIDEIVESPIVQEEKLFEEEEKTAPIEAADHSELENLTESDNKNIEEPIQQQQQQYQQESQFEFQENIEEVQPRVEESEFPVEIETEKDNVQEKEPIEEERHVLDDIEKDLQLVVETEEPNEMDSQLNPDAKEFVPLSPVSPVRNEFQFPPPGLENEKSPFVNHILSGFTDPVVSQSPRKGDIAVMEDVTIPEENEFEKEADARAHEVNLLEENFQNIESPEELNLKEAMQTDDKLEQGYKDDSQAFFEEEKLQTGDEYKVLESSFDQYSNGFQSKIEDPMNRSFYEGRDNDILADPAKSILNTTQPLSDNEDTVEINKEQDIVIESVKSEEVDFLGTAMEPIVEQKSVFNQFEAMTVEDKEPISQMESSDNFEAEKFVEEIKGINESFNKYVDTELSPTMIPEVVPSEIQTVEETIFATHSPMNTFEDTNLDTFITQTSQVSNIDLSTEATKQEIIEEFERQQSEIKENIPETFEPVQQEELIPTMEAPAHEVTPPPIQTPEAQEIAVEEEKPPTPSPSPISEIVPEIPQEDEKIESKTEEIVAAGITAAAIGSMAAVSAVSIKSSAGKKPEAKKPIDAKAKVPTKPADAIKKTEIKPKTAPISKAAAKPPVSKVAPQKPAPSSATTARPKTTTISAVKKAPIPAKPTEAKPKEITSSKPTAPNRSTLPPKRPVSSAPTSKPAPPKPTTDVKTKVNGTTERKPLASSAPSTRAPPKPTSLTVKSKVSETSTTAAKSPSTKVSARLSTSAIEKSASSPLKEKSLNKSLSATTTSKSPRTVSSTSTIKTTVKTDLKSPLAKPSTLSAVGTKKPLTTVKKLPVSEKTTTITKKPVGTGAVKSSTVKKTTTTVIKKKVVNGDIVEETKNTIITESSEEVPPLNGHHVNGNTENGVEHESEEQAVVAPTI